MMENVIDFRITKVYSRKNGGMFVGTGGCDCCDFVGIIRFQVIRRFLYRVVRRLIKVLRGGGEYLFAFAKFVSLLTPLVLPNR